MSSQFMLITTKRKKTKLDRGPVALEFLASPGVIINSSGIRVSKVSYWEDYIVKP